MRLTGMPSLHYVPMVGTLSFGLAHHFDDYEFIYDQMDEALVMQKGHPALCLLLLHDRRQRR